MQEHWEYRREDQEWLRRPRSPLVLREPTGWRNLPRTVLRWFGGIALSTMAGLGTAAFFSLWAGLVYVIGGDRVVVKYGVGFTDVARGYFAAGLIGGIVVGMLLPLARWRAGAALLGIMGGLITYGSVAVSMEGWPLKGSGLLVAIVPGTIVGVLVSMYLWEDDEVLRLRA